LLKHLPIVRRRLSTPLEEHLAELIE